MSFNGNLQPSSDAGEDLTTKGDLHTYSTENTALPVGADTRILQANSATSTGLEWIVAGGGGIEQFFTITTNGTTTPTSQTGNKAIVIDTTSLTDGQITVNVDGSAYLAVPTGKQYAIAVAPASSLNFVTGGTGRQLSTASFIQNSNYGSTIANPIGLWCDPTGHAWAHGGGNSSGSCNGSEILASAWDMTGFTQDLNTYSGNPYGSTTVRGVSYRYTSGTPSYAGGASGDSQNMLQTGGSAGDGISVASLYPNYWKSGGVVGTTDEATLTPTDNDMYGLATSPDQKKWFTVGRQHDKMYAWETRAGQIGGYAKYINNADGGGTGINGDGTLVADKSISAQLTDMVDISFTDDGLWCVVAGGAGNLFSYVLTSAHDLTTATYDQTYSTSAQSTSLGGIQVKDDGTRVYVLDSTANPNYIMEYNTEGSMIGTAKIAIIGS